MKSLMKGNLSNKSVTSLKGAAKYIFELTIMLVIWIFFMKYKNHFISEVSKTKEEAKQENPSVKIPKYSIA
jgi:predicted PurR-regulated permease PerM